MGLIKEKSRAITREFKKRCNIKKDSGTHHGQEQDKGIIGVY